MERDYRQFIAEKCAQEHQRLTILITTNDSAIIGDLIHEGDPSPLIDAIAMARSEENFEHIYDAIHSYGEQRRNFYFEPPTGTPDQAHDQITADFMRENGIVFYLRYDLDDYSEESIRIIDLR